MSTSTPYSHSDDPMFTQQGFAPDPELEKLLAEEEAVEFNAQQSAAYNKAKAEFLSALEFEQMQHQADRALASEVREILTVIRSTRRVVSNVNNEEIGYDVLREMMAIIEDKLSAELTTWEHR